MLHTLKDITIPSFDLTGKVALITGGSRGLGYATAVTFAHYGAKVAIAARTEEDLNRVTEELKSLGCSCLAIKTDVLEQEQIDNMVAKTVEHFGKIDILVNSAGRASTVKATEMSIDEWDDVVDLDLKALFFVSQAVAKQMIEQGNGGKIINISSAAGVMGSKGIAHYCAAKAGVLHVTKSMALEWAKNGILVNAICPGYFPTTLNEEWLAKPNVKEAIENFTAVKRLATFDEVVAPILLLASNHSGYITGTHILIDGGANAQ